jgi:hypothetical protein
MPRYRRRRSYSRPTRWRTRYAPSIRRYGRRARGGIAGLRKLSVKNVVVGSLGLWLIRRLNPFGGMYKPAVDKVATGFVLGMAGMDNGDLITVGVKEGVATLADSFIGGGWSVGTSTNFVG